MLLLQLPDTQEREEETVEPDLEGKYQTEWCVNFGFSKTRMQHCTIQKVCQKT